MTLLPDIGSLPLLTGLPGWASVGEDALSPVKIGTQGGLPFLRGVGEGVMRGGISKGGTGRRRGKRDYNQDVK